MRTIDSTRRMSASSGSGTTSSASVTGGASLGAGLAGALLASLCCLLPAVALSVGVGSAAGLVQLGAYQPYVLAAGVLLTAGWNGYLLRRQVRCCKTTSERRALYLWTLLSAALFAGVYLVVNNLLVPWLYEVASRPMPPM